MAGPAGAAPTPLHKEDREIELEKGGKDNVSNTHWLGSEQHIMEFIVLVSILQREERTYILFRLLLFRTVHQLPSLLTSNISRKATYSFSDASTHSLS